LSRFWPHINRKWPPVNENWPQLIQQIGHPEYSQKWNYHILSAFATISKFILIKFGQSLAVKKQKI
jgi:hypothetical protein